MLFLSVGLLVTFSSWSGAVDVSRGDETGVAWGVGVQDSVLDAVPAGSSWDELRHPAFFTSNAEPSSFATIRGLSKRQTFPLAVSVPSSSAEPRTPGVDPPANKMEEPEQDDEQRPRRRDWERFIGRASAWMCTTLYLTSRLPQIWQNVRRLTLLRCQSLADPPAPPRSSADGRLRA